MKLSGIVTGVAVVIAMSCVEPVGAETAKEAFSRGGDLLAEGNFQEALEAYSTAVRAERTNQAYSQQFMLVRQVVTLRAMLDREKDEQRWLNIAQPLRAFYVSEGLHSEALPVDEAIHARLDSAFSAGQLAETLLTMGRDAQASEVLSALDTEKGTTATQALLGISLARQGKTGEAQAIVEAVADSESRDPGTLYVVARLQAIAGHQEAAMVALTRCIEGVPPSALDGLRAHARQTPEFASFVSTESFDKTLQTKSKVVESACSSGSSCAGCPMRGACDSDHE